MLEYMYDESVQICDDGLEFESVISSKHRQKAGAKLHSPFSNSDSENELLYLSDYRGGITMSAQGHENDDDAHNSNGQVISEKTERPITRAGTRQKTATQQPPPPSGRPGTAGRNGPSSSRPRPPSPEPSEEEEEEELDEMGNDQMEGVGLYDESASSDDVSENQSLRTLFKMADNTDMSCSEFSQMLRMFPDNAESLYPEPYSEPCTYEDQEVQNALAKKRWIELVLEQKREVLRIEARLSRNPGIHGIKCKGMYNAEDYANLSTTPEIKQLFEYITKYLPSASVTPEVKFRPFIREYEASVGDIDAFIKVQHPDIKNDGLGIKVLDEPSAFQSDPSVLDLRLRAMAKQSSAKAVVVKKVENAHRNPKIIDNWIKDISDLHRSKPSPSVHYSKPMPDIDLLLQEWPPEFEELLKNVTTPSANLDCDLKTYVDLVCNVLDIPVYKSRIQSLHVLATLYATHKNFNNYGPSFGSVGNEPRRVPSTSNSYRLEENMDRMEL